MSDQLASNTVINYLNPDKYVINPKLQKALQSGSFNNDRSLSKDNKGIYLIMFRVLNNNSNVLVYNYLYYPIEFMECLKYYLIYKDKSNHPFFKEWGDYLSIIDPRLFDKVFISDFDGFFEGEYKYKNSNHNNLLLSYEIDYIYNKLLYLYNLDVKSISDIFNLINRLIYLTNVNDMPNLLDLAYKKNYFKFMFEILGQDICNAIRNKIILPNDEEYANSISIINGCLFIVNDLNLFLNSIKDKGLNVNGGPQRYRSQVNSINSFLNCFDTDFRNSIYNHNQIHIKKGLNNKLYLGRNLFTFNNIHMNMGSVRWYSTYKSNFITKRPTPSLGNRQQLIEKNYTIVDEILEKNYYVGTNEVQRQIELAIYEQENNYANENIILNKLKFNKETFDLINFKNTQLIKLLSKPKDNSAITVIQSTKFIPWYEEITLELGAQKVSALLLSFFMELLVLRHKNHDDIETTGIPTITAFNKFGINIVNKYMYAKYNKSQNKNQGITFSEYKHKTHEEYKDVYEDNFHSRVGGFFVWQLVVVKLLYPDLDSDPSDPKKSIQYLRVVVDIWQIMIKNQHKIFHLPHKLPMVCEPKKFIHSKDLKKNKLGGYLLNDEYYTDGIFKDKIGYGKSTSLKDKNIIISLVNGLNKTPYKINTNTLDFIYRFGIDKKILIDESSEDMQTYMKDPYTKQNKSLKSKFSKIIMEKNILSIAETYSKVDKIYFPVRLDQRTRIYCKTDYLDYQKNDLAKGLISFANPGTITKYDIEIIKYFKAYGANMFGNNLDKKSINYRVKWVDDNADKILAFEFNDIVDSAESKVCFISFCFEFKRFTDFWVNKDQSVFYTYLPIQLDASCNGYQHLALLTNENYLFNKLNLDVSTHDDDPDDFYTYILNKTNDYIENMILQLTELNIKNNKQDKNLISFNKLKSVSFDRSIIKKTVMTESYSAGIPKLVNNILLNITPHYNKGKTEYYTYKDLDIKLYREDIVTFVTTMKKVIKVESPKIQELSKYLNAIVSICTKLSIPIPWNLPSGAIINESYLVEKEQSITAFSFIKSRYTFKKYLKEEYDLDKQRRAIRPNLIHSLDGTTIAMLYNSMKHIDIYTVHDCFAVTANNVPYLIKILKMVYIKLYSSNSYLLEFDSFVRETINKSFGDDILPVNAKYIFIPEKGKLTKRLYPDVYKIVKSNNNEIIKLKKSANIII